MKSVFLRALYCSLVIILVIIAPVLAFSPNEIVVVYNTYPTMQDASYGVAQYYAQVRGIPQANLVGVYSPSFEETTGSQYIQYIATPISAYLSTNPNIKAIVLCYGIPTRIEGTNTGSVDSALMLMGNPNILSQTH